jgi:hypothetical protein
MKKQEIRDFIYAGLKEVLVGAGFKLNKKEGAFSRSIPNGFQRIYVPLYDYNPEFVFSLTIGIRLDAVEDIFNQFSGAMGPGQAQTTTSLTQLGYFAGENQKEYRVSTKEEIDSALSDLTALINSKILPFLEQYQDVPSLDDAINRKKLPGFDSTELLSHAMHSITLAKLAGNPSFSALVTEYAKALENFHPADRERFDRLAASLDRVSTTSR